MPGKISLSGRTACAAVVCALLVSSASAAPIEWNGHCYESFPDHTTWYDARDTAASMTYMGVAGHLVTITSSAENDWVYNHQIDSNGGDWRHRGNWIGAYQAGASINLKDHEQGFAPGDHWAWVTGEAWTYSNWVPGEPDDGAYG